MKRPFLVASDLRPCVPVDDTQQRNGDDTDWDKLDVILRAYRYAMILVVCNGDILRPKICTRIINCSRVTTGFTHMTNITNILFLLLLPCQDCIYNSTE